MKIYAGIGSRQTPQHVLNVMVSLAVGLAGSGYTLRSGAAQGADQAFERGCDEALGDKEIYIPWSGFQGRVATATTHVGVVPAALQLAEEFHPNWKAVSWAGKTLHARNCYQVLGRNLDTPAAFVICWTPDGKGGGGTGQAIRVANYFQVPVIDLGSMSSLDMPDLYKALVPHLVKES